MVFMYFKGFSGTAAKQSLTLCCVCSIAWLTLRSAVLEIIEELNGVGVMV